MKKPVYVTPSRRNVPIYTHAGRICHTYLNGDLALTRVMDDFGNSVEVDKESVLWFIRGPKASYQPAH